MKQKKSKSAEFRKALEANFPGHFFRVRKNRHGFYDLTFGSRHGNGAVSDDDSAAIWQSFSELVGLKLLVLSY